MRKLRTMGVLTAGIAIGALLLPAGAVRAALPSFVAISNPGGSQVAQVTKAKQVLASEFDPAATLVAQAMLPFDTCKAVYTVPTGKAFVVKEMNAAFGDNEDPNRRSIAAWISPCTQPHFAIVVADPGFASQSQTFGTGVVVPSGQTIYARNDGHSVSFITLYGYLIPAAAAPDGTQFVVAPGEPTGRQSTRSLPQFGAHE